MSDATTSGKKKPKSRARRRGGRIDPVERDFGPGEETAPLPPEPEAPSASGAGPFPGLACGGDSCLLKPAADLVGRFTLSLAGRAALGRAAFSGVELLKALRDFLNEEIALAERAAGKGETSRQHYERIKVE